MPRQPTSTPQFQRESHIRHPKKKYYVICEGRTEKDYLDCLKDSRLLKDNLYLFKISKKGIERDMSDRMEMISTAESHMFFEHEGRSTLRRYITEVLSDFYS